MPELLARDISTLDIPKRAVNAIFRHRDYLSLPENGVITLSDLAKVDMGLLRTIRGVGSSAVAKIVENINKAGI